MDNAKKKEGESKEGECRKPSYKERSRYKSGGVSYGLLSVVTCFKACTLLLIVRFSYRSLPSSVRHIQSRIM